LVEQWPVGFPAGDASGQASPPTFLERSTVVDPQSGAPAQTGSSFADADHRWDGYDQVSGYAGNGHEQTRALDNGSGDGSRSLLSDHTDPSMPYPAIRSAETAYQYSDHNPGAMAALLDMSDRRWFTVVVTGGLALVLLAIVYAAFTLGGDDSPNESVIAGSTTLPGSTSSIPEGSAGAPTIEDPTSTVEDPSSAGGSVETTESTDTTVTSVVDEMVEVPRLRGYGRVIASDILRELDLGVNVQERKVPVGSGENALVIDQDPDPGTMVEPGTVVTIYVAQESSNQ
jgi:hypothetical protein